MESAETMNMTENQKDYSHRILTIPNLMSFFRFILIPVFIYYYLHENDMAAFITLGLSALSDLFDGKVARALNQVSELGKALDPVADKTTQMVVILCMVRRYSYLKPLLILQIIKESVLCIINLLVLHKEKAVRGAEWHGKILTTCIDILILIHLLPFDVPQEQIFLLLYLTEGMMILSFIIYFIRNMKILMNR